MKTLARAVTMTTATLTIVSTNIYTAQPASGATISRITNYNRYLSSIDISKHSYPNGASVVYVARGDVFNDALAAGNLKNGPILLTPKTDVPSNDLQNEINRLRPNRVVIIGGTSSLSNTFMKRIGGNRKKVRLGGANRYETAVAITRYAFPKGANSTYIVGTGSYADNVSANNVIDGAILPIPQGAKNYPRVISHEITRLKSHNIVAVGSGRSVTSFALTAAYKDSLKIKKTRGTIKRLNGSNIYHTSLTVASKSYPRTANILYLASGKSYKDAVAAGAVPNGPVLLIDNNIPLSSFLSFAKRLNPSKIVVIGGSNVLSDFVVNSFVKRLSLNGGAPVPQTPTPQPAPPEPVTPAPVPPTPQPPVPVPTAPTNNTLSSFEAEIFRLTNIERAKAGLPAFKPDSCLSSIANDWSNYLQKTNTFTHGDFSTRVKKCYTNSFGGENIAMSYGTPQAFVIGWMNSPGHRANILNPRFEYLGVGVSVNGEYATQDFSSRQY